MVNINIELPDELHKGLKLHAIREGTTLKEVVNEALQNGKQH